MAGEKKGKAYEAFVALALNGLRDKRIFSGEIFWDKTPEEMTIMPDLTIGKNKDCPHTVLLITHSGSAKESEKKGWRNMGELAEAKVCLPEPPRVFNIAFDSVIKENLKLAQEASFDGQLIVGDLKYGAKLQNWVDNNLSRIPKDKDEKVTFLKSETASDKGFESLLDNFSKDLIKLLGKKTQVALDNLWKMERKRQFKRTARVPRARNTFVRRGLSKLLIFEDIDLAIKLFSGERVKMHRVPAYAFELGLAGKAVGRAIPMDEEISNAISLLRLSDISTIKKDAPQEKMLRWIYPLRTLGEIQNIHGFISQNWSNLKKPGKMLAMLRLVHDKPDNIMPGKITSSVNWLYFSIVDLLKANAGNNQSFGYAQMLRKIKVNKEQIDDFLAKKGLPLLKLRGQSFIVRGLTDWLSRLDTTQARGFSIQFQAAVAYILSNEIAAQHSLPDWEEVKKVSIKTTTVRLRFSE